MSADPGSALAKARIGAHHALDVWWEFESMTRTEAYRRLAKDMNLEPGRCHIGLFDEEQCLRAIEICHGWIVKEHA